MKPLALEPKATRMTEAKLIKTERQQQQQQRIAPRNNKKKKQNTKTKKNNGKKWYKRAECEKEEQRGAHMQCVDIHLYVCVCGCNTRTHSLQFMATIK